MMYEDEPLTRLGVELRHEDRHGEAVAVLREAVVAREASAPRELAYALLGTDRPRDALKVVKREIREGRSDLSSLLGSLAARLGDIKMADKYYQKAIAGGDLSALNDYGTLLAGEQRFGEAIDMFTRSAAFGDVLAPGNLIAIYVDDLEDFDSAVTFGEQYLDSSKPGVYPALADAYAHLGRFEEAENLFQQALELGAPRVHQKYAWFLWLQRNDLTGAEREFWAAHDHDEEGWSHALGYFLIDQKRIPEARAVLERGVSWGDLDASDLLDDLGRDDMK